MTTGSFKRGEVVAARLEPTEGSEQGGTRPVVVVSNDLFNEAMSILSIVPVTSRVANRRAYPSEVALARGDAGLRTDSLALCHQVRTIARARIGRRIGRLDDATMGRLDQGLRLHLGLGGT